MAIKECIIVNVLVVQTNVPKPFPPYFGVCREEKDRFRFVDGIGFFDHGKVVL